MQSTKCSVARGYRPRVWSCGRNGDVQMGWSADGSRSKRRLHHGAPCMIKPNRISSSRF